MDDLRGRPVLVEFWDFCRPNSLRTMPYLKAWHARYGEGGLVVVGVHTPGFRASANEDAVRDAVERLEVRYPVLLDTDYAMWHEYENAGWPGRYVWNGEGALADYHYGEGDYADCEEVVCELLGVAFEPLAPLRPEDAPGAVLGGPERGPPRGAVLRSLRGGRGVGGARAARAGRAHPRQRRRGRRPPPRRLPARAARSPQRRRAGARACPAHAMRRRVLHAGPPVGSLRELSQEHRRPDPGDRAARRRRAREARSGAGVGLLGTLTGSGRVTGGDRPGRRERASPVGLPRARTPPGAVQTPPEPGERSETAHHSLQTLESRLKDQARPGGEPGPAS